MIQPGALENMTFDEYQEYAKRSANHAFATKDDALYNWIIGIIGEAGEISALIKTRLEGDRNDFMLMSVLHAAILLSQISEPLKKTMFHGKPSLDEKRDEIIHTCRALASVARDIESVMNYTENTPLGYYGHRVHNTDVTGIADESGDLKWYDAMLNDFFGIPYSESAKVNILKLSKRWPDGFVADGRALADKGE